MAKASTRPPPAAAKPRTMEIDVSPSPEASEALTLREQADRLTVSDQPTHRNALEFVRGAKQLKRKIEDHWSRITRVIDETKRNLLDLKRQDLEPVDAAISTVERRALDYAEIQKRLEREEQDRLRRKAEQDAQTRRDRELADQERRALDLEKASADLSPRERLFVEAILAGAGGAAAAQRAEFKDPARAAERLLATPKILQAIEHQRSANAIRDQAAAKRDAPLDVVVPKAETHTARVSGTRTVTYYSCEIVDETRFRAAFVAGLIPSDSMLPNQPELNRAAGRLVDTFEAAYPGTRLVKRQGIAG
jgi:hypothetical protein